MRSRNYLFFCGAVFSRGGCGGGQEGEQVRVGIFKNNTLIICVGICFFRGESERIKVCGYFCVRSVGFSFFKKGTLSKISVK